MTKHSTIPCDKKGRPITPADVRWQDALTRAIIFLALGVVLLPAGFLLYNLVALPDNMGAVRFFFAVLIFFGAIFMFYGVLISVLALVQRRKAPSADEVKELATKSGEVCRAVVTGVKTKTKAGGETLYRYSLEYFDDRYNYRRRFKTDYISRKAKAGDAFTVHYAPDSNIIYYVVTD